MTKIGDVIHGRVEVIDRFPIYVYDENDGELRLHCYAIRVRKLKEATK